MLGPQGQEAGDPLAGRQDRRMFLASPQCSLGDPICPSCWGEAPVVNLDTEVWVGCCQVLSRSPDVREPPDDPSVFMCHFKVALTSGQRMA